LGWVTSSLRWAGTGVGVADDMPETRLTLSLDTTAEDLPSVL
jgi:hypothetical protein